MFISITTIIKRGKGKMQNIGTRMRRGKERGVREREMAVGRGRGVMRGRRTEVEGDERRRGHGIRGGEGERTVEEEEKGEE